MEDEMTSKRFKRGIRWKIEKGIHGIFGKKAEFEKGLSNEIGGEFEKNSRGDLLCICVLQHKQDSNTKQTQEH
jgi:hypothetical protein